MNDHDRDYGPVLGLLLVLVLLLIVAGA